MNRRLDPDAVQAKLVRIDELVTRLAPRRGRTAEDLLADAVERDSTLWILRQLVTLASSVADHVAATQLGRGPASYADGFSMLVEAGVVDSALETPLRGAAGMRNVIVHQYEEIDLDIVAAAIGPACDTFSALRTQVAAWLLDRV